MTKNLLYILLSFLFILIGCNSKHNNAKTNIAVTPQPVISGAEWYDTDGNVINAHGGGLLFHEGRYYWYGEYKGDSTY